MKNMKKSLLFVLFLMVYYGAVAQNGTPVEKSSYTKTTMDESKNKDEKSKKELTKTEKIILGREWLSIMATPFELSMMFPDKGTLALLLPLYFSLLYSLGMIGVVNTQRDNKKLSTLQKLVLGVSMIGNTLQIYHMYGENKNLLSDQDLNFLGKSIAFLVANALYTVPAMLTLNYAYNVLQKETKFHEKIKNFAQKIKIKSKNALEKLWPSKSYVR